MIGYWSPLPNGQFVHRLFDQKPEQNHLSLPVMSVNDIRLETWDLTLKNKAHNNFFNITDMTLPPDYLPRLSG